MYFTGGLEDNEEPKEILQVDDVDYVVSDKFKTMLRDSFIDWGTFLEIYEDNITYTSMFDQIIKILNVKNDDLLKDVMLPLVKKIYELPAEAHLACLMKQFMVYEPISIAIQSLFMLLKNHYEYLIERFITGRNKYINDNDITAQTNDWDALLDKWYKFDDEFNLQSSSLILLMLNPPNHIDSGIHFDLPKNIKLKNGKVDNEASNLMDKLQSSITKFSYPGFCPKVPKERIAKLLQFPVMEFIKATKHFLPKEIFPNYQQLEKTISEIEKKLPPKPIIKNNIKKETPPSKLTKFLNDQHERKKIKGEDDAHIEKQKIKLVKWYMHHILEYRKKLLPYGKLYENYYIAVARNLTEITEAIKKEFL